MGNTFDSNLLFGSSSPIDPAKLLHQPIASPTATLASFDEQFRHRHDGDGGGNEDNGGPLGYTGVALGIYQKLVNVHYSKEEDAKVIIAPPPDSLSSKIPHPFEDHYIRPHGTIALPRKFYPFQKDDEKDYRLVACKLVPHNAREEDIRNYVEFMKQTKNALTKKINSKIKFHFMEELKKEGVEYKGKPVTCVLDVYRAFKEELSMPLCIKILKVFWGSVETDDFMNKFEYVLMWECGLWYGTDKDDLATTTGGKNFIGFVRSHAANQIRNNYRKNFQRDNSGHGVTLRISAKGGRTGRRRIKGVFDADNIQGWDEPKHLVWQQTKKRTNDGAKAFKMVTRPVEENRAATYMHRKSIDEELKLIDSISLPAFQYPIVPAGTISKQAEMESELEVRKIMETFAVRDMETCQKPALQVCC